MDKFVNNIFLCYFKWLAFVLLKKMLRKKIISQHFLNYDLENMSIYIRDRKMLKDEISEKDLGKRLYFTTTYGKFKSNTF